MTLVKRGKFFHYDFLYRGVRHQKSTEQTDRTDAQLVEDAAKQQLRREAHGLIALHPEVSPRIAEFADVFYAEQERRLTRPDVLERTLRVVMGFWGKKPKTNPVKDAPYHNLRLADPIIDPRWLDKFEQWMDARGLAGSTRNSYLSAMSGLYKLAAKARYRARTGVDRNPFADIGRHRPRIRQVTTTKDDLVKWMQHGAPHFRLALAIGGLAHKLRVSQVLELRFDKHIDPEMTRITFDHHKTIRHTRKAQVTQISGELRRVLEQVKKARPKATYVVTWRGKPVGDLKTAAKGAAERAGLRYGLADGAVTFHALRHISSTELARMGVSAAMAAKAGGHLDPRTTEKHYTHLIDDDERRVVEQLGTRLGLADEAIRGVETSVESRRSTPDRARAERTTRKSVRSKRKIAVTH